MKKTVLLSAILLAACGSQTNETEAKALGNPAIDVPVNNTHVKAVADESLVIHPKVVGRWYSQQQVEEGKALFARTCAACHGTEAQGLVKDWKQPDVNGVYPPPPLDGSAHAWHHPLTALKHTIKEGGAPVGGVMPAFKHSYTDEQIESLIASIQSRWSDKIYQAWQARNK